MARSKYQLKHSMHEIIGYNLYSWFIQTL